MADFKIALGLEIDANEKARIQSIIDDIRNEKPEIKVDINTEQALKDIKTLQKELKKLKDISIKIKTVNTNASTGKKAKQNLNLPSTERSNVNWDSGDTQNVNRQEIKSIYEE